MQVGICDDQEETRELIADKVKIACPEANIIQIRAGGTGCINASRHPVS